MESYRRLTRSHVHRESWRGKDFLILEPEALRLLAEEAFHDLGFYLRTSHLKKMAAVLRDPEASENDRYVVRALLTNAAISAEGILPLCQDTGTATVVAWKGERVFLEGSEGDGDKAHLSRGVFDAYDRSHFRYSQVAAFSMFDEADTGTNLPAQIDVYSEPGEEYRFLFVAKGGGSANKTSFFQESKALLTPEKLERFLREKVAALGTAACPPYHLAVVIGGLSAENNLKTLKLATTGFLDDLPAAGNKEGAAFLDREWSDRLLKIARESGLGAQFGGRHLALDARVIRLTRHAGSCPVSIGVSCCADRNVLGKITAEGIFLEKLDRDPARFLVSADAGKPSSAREASSVPRIDLKKSMHEIRTELSKHPTGSLVLLSGPVVVARDIVHAKLAGLVERGEPLPRYFLDHPVYYAGPSKTPPGYVIGSFGPTTAQRMDSYLAGFMKLGASLVTLAKGNRSPQVTAACKDSGGFYLGTIGGAAALLAKENITASEVVGFPELGMEAVRLIEVKDFPVFILVDDKGNDFYRCIAENRV